MALTIQQNAPMWSRQSGIALLLMVTGLCGRAWADCSQDVTVSIALTSTQEVTSIACNYYIADTGSVILGVDRTAIQFMAGASIGTFINSGIIRADGALANGVDIGSAEPIKVGSFINAGEISATSQPALRVSKHPINNIGNVIDVITNLGVIQNSPNNLTQNTNPGIFVTSTNVGALINIGTISSTLNEGFLIDPGSQLTTLTNIGTISGGRTGISAKWTVTGTGTLRSPYRFTYPTITTLNNRQGKSSTALAYGVVNETNASLPLNYNVIIASPSNYGQLDVRGSVYKINSTGVVFNIYGNTGTTLVSYQNASLSTIEIPASFIEVGTYSSVLSGLTSSDINSASLSGIYPGGFAWQLALQSGSSSIWDLIVTTACATGCSGNSSIGNIVVGGTFSLANVGTSVNPVFAGGALLLAAGDSSSQSFSVLSSGGTITAPSAGTATLSGMLSGMGGLTFNGTGTIVLSGLNSYSGGTTVASGTLSVSGNSPTGTGSVYVASGATLMGTGTIAGAVFVDGIIKPGNSPGYLATSSSITMNSGSVYQQDISGLTQASVATPSGSAGSYSYLTTGGQFIINSGATLTPRLADLFSASESGYGSSVYAPALGDRFRIVTAAGGVTGRFDSLIQPAELMSGSQFIAFYNVNASNALDLMTVPSSYTNTLSSNTKNAKEVASVLDQLLGVNKSGTATAAQESLLYAAAGQTAASLPSFASGLSGEIHAASITTLSQTTQRLQHAVLARLGDYPMAPSFNASTVGGSPLTSSLSATNPSGLPTANVSSNPLIGSYPADLTAQAMVNGNAWGEIAYQRVERSGNSGGNGYNNNLYQAVFGADVDLNSELDIKLGGGFALSSTSVGLGSNTHSNSTAQQGALFVYGKMPIFQDYVLDGMISIGLSSTNLSRNDPTGLSAGFSKKAVMGNDGLVSAGVSRPFQYSNLRLTPYARLTYQYVGQAAYSEGSAVAALNIGRFGGSGARGVIGVAADSLTKDPLKDDYTYRANLAVGADSNALLNPTVNTTLGGYSSNVTTATAGAAFVQLGLYGTVKVSDNAYAYAGVLGEVRTGQTLYGGNVGLRLAF